MGDFSKNASGATGSYNGDAKLSKAKEAEAMGVKPVTPTDIQYGKDAPPDYSTVMGEYQTTIVFQQPELPPLAYIDIMPQVLEPGNIRYNKAPTFANFSEIVNGANLWLTHNPELLCWKCETVERKVGSGTKIDLGNMSYQESAQGFNCRVLGLRIWFVKKPTPSPAQQLGLVNVVPEHGMADCVNTVGFQTGNIPGSILNVETTTIKWSIGYSKFDPDKTCFAELGAGGEDIRKSRQILRVFYVKGPAKTEALGMQEFHPRQTRFTGSVALSKFETFEELLGQAREWLRVQSGIRVVNVETRDVQGDISTKTIKLMADKTDDFTSDSECIYVSILRLFYVKTPEVISPYANTVLTLKTFTPAKLGGKQFETMPALMNRIVSWLQVTQLPIFNVETVLLPFVPNSVGVSPNRVDYQRRKGAGHVWVTAIRLYFPVPFQDTVQVEGPKSGACVVL